MPFPRLIPCLDVAHGRVVKGVGFKQLRVVGNPVELAAVYASAGADELVFLDVKATVEGRALLRGLIERVADVVTIPFTVGGGVRSVADADSLLRAGADKVVINSACIERPALIGELAARFGSQAIVVAIDAAGGRVWTRAATQPTDLGVVEWARAVQERGAGEVLLTSIDFDGSRRGYDLELVTRVARAVSVPVIASGGAGRAQHVIEILRVAQAALLASILHEDPQRLGRIRDEVQASGMAMRDAG